MTNTIPRRQRLYYDHLIIINKTYGDVRRSMGGGGGSSKFDPTTWDSKTRLKNKSENIKLDYVTINPESRIFKGWPTHI